jgi:hypothetical protein
MPAAPGVCSRSQGPVRLGWVGGLGDRGPGSVAVAPVLDSDDELASMTYRHTGSGDMHIGGSARRPTEAQNLDALRFGRSNPLEGPNAVQYIKDGIRVLINQDMPWRSTANDVGG